MTIPVIAAVAEMGLWAFCVVEPFGMECFRYSFTFEEGGNIFIKVSKMAGSFLLISLSPDIVDATGNMMFLSWNFCVIKRLELVLKMAPYSVSELIKNQKWHAKVTI